MFPFSIWFVQHFIHPIRFEKRDNKRFCWNQNKVKKKLETTGVCVNQFLFFLFLFVWINLLLVAMVRNFRWNITTMMIYAHLIWWSKCFLFGWRTKNQIKWKNFPVTPVCDHHPHTHNDLLFLVTKIQDKKNDYRTGTKMMMITFFHLIWSNRSIDWLINQIKLHRLL